MTLGSARPKKPVEVMTRRILTRGAATAAIAVFALGLGQAQATPLTLNSTENVPDATKSSFEINGTRPEQLVLSLGRLPPSTAQPSKAVDAKNTIDQSPAAPEWTNLSRLALAPHGSSGEASATGTDTGKVVLPALAESAPPPDERAEQGSLQVGEFRASSSDGTPNYFGAVLNDEQTVAPDHPNPDAGKDDVSTSNTQIANLPTNLETSGPVAFSNLGVPVVSESDTTPAQVANRVDLSTSNNELIAADSDNSTTGILDLIGEDDVSLDPREALLALEIRHTLLDVRDTVSDIRQAVSDSLVNTPLHSVLEPAPPPKRFAGTEDSDSTENSHRDAGADTRSPFADALIHNIAIVSITIRNYFWLLLVFYVAALTLRWALKRR